MDVGGAMFFTDYSITPAELGPALEARGFESLWAPEHSHIPASRQSPFPAGGDLPKKYYDVMDPFVTLTAAAAATKTLKVATGICLVVQRDPIQTAKLVASIDQVSGGRFLFGVGAGWNAEEMADHGTEFKSRFKLMEERILAMKAIWTQSKAEYHGAFVDFPPLMTWPKPVQEPHPPVLVGGSFPGSARRALAFGDGWMPQAARPGYADVTEFLPRFRQMAAEAGRDPASIPVTIWGCPEDADRLKRLQDLGIARVVVSFESVKADALLPLLDRWATLIAGVRG
jgi:probable F420-dependent oxidoreductase